MLHRSLTHAAVITIRCPRLGLQNKKQNLELDSLPNTTLAAIEPNFMVTPMSITSQGSAEYGILLSWGSGRAAGLHDLLRLGKGLP